MRIRDVYIERYGPLPRFTHDCTENIEVFYGPNESGKTLLLEATLELLSPNIDSTIPAITRVDETPSGHVVLEAHGDEHKLGDGAHLQDVSNVTARHLRNIFVIRDSDLVLKDEHEFYDSVTQQIGDLHTAEIEAIQEKFVEKGHLTSVGGRRLSEAEDRQRAKRERNEARRLAGDIREYVETAADDDIAAAEREFLAVNTDLQQCTEELETQEAARTLDTHATLAERLESFEIATQELAEDVSESTLDELEELERSIEEGTDEIGELEEKRAALRRKRDELESKKEKIGAELAPSTSREQDVDDIERALDSFRETHGDAVGADRGMQFAQYLAIGGIVLGGIAAVVGSTIAGLFLAGIGAAAAGWYGLQHRAVTAAERERERVLQRARDAGFDATTIDAIGPAIREFRDARDHLQERHSQLEQEISVTSDRIDDRETRLDTERTERRENRERKRSLLQEAEVATIDDYREHVERRSELERKRGEAARSLADTLGEPDGDAPSPDAKIEYWSAQLESMVADIDQRVTADVYDPDRLADLREETTRLQQRRRELNARLEDHQQKLDDFAERVQEISAQPFLDEHVTLPARSLEGLRDLAGRLERLVGRIEREADIAREALGIFDEIEATEEEKITDLFGADSTATSVFSRLTDGRYSEVTYEPASKQLHVRRDGQDVLTPRELSHATTDQLYMATRVGLANRLLGSEPGFLLLDDAFLPADSTRLANGFDVLRNLADDGWQILYFTAKDEVGVDIVESHGLSCRELDPLG
jgi:uncharacterized protein YhaN